ncbi:hypothetical protein ACFVJ4_43755 [Streptomyces sp. NPDC127178]|uniref:hypothetical protein n=1 Tax=unclassified Streptomyces TaxID=2593676 RepID=UPI0036361FD6
MSHSRRSRTGTRAVSVSVAALGMVAVMVTPAEANHEGAHTTAEIMADCESGLGKCTFGDAGWVPGTGDDLQKVTYVGNWRRASGDGFNCTSSTQRQSITWAQTTGTTDTIGVTIKVEAGIGKIFKVAVETKYEHSWTDERTHGETVNIDIKPGYIGWIERGQVMNRFTGRWRTHYNDPMRGHYYWATPYDTVTSPAEEGENGIFSNVLWRERPMTRDELIRNGCPVTSTTIASGATLRAGWATVANLTRLVMQGDGNLVMYRLRDGAAIWSTHTSGHPGAYAKMQTDGNFVVYDADNRTLWSTRTNGNPNAWAIMQNDGNLVIYKSTGGPGKGGALWASGTTATAR